MNKFCNVTLLILLFIFGYNTASSLPLKNFSHLPVLHEGRIKPLDSFANISLLYVHGKKNIDNLTSIEWLLELFFDHEKSYNRKIFNIKDQTIIINIGADIKVNNEYSLNDIALPILNNLNLIESLSNLKLKDRTASQNNLLNIYLKVLLVIKLSFFADNVLPNFFSKDNTNIKFSKYDILKNNLDLNNYIVLETNIYSKIKTKFKNILDDPKYLFFFPTNNLSWINVNDCNLKDYVYNKGIDLFNDIAKSYHNNDKTDWNFLCLKLKENTLSHLEISTKTKINLELFYNSLSPIYLSFIVYVIVFILSFFLLLNKNMFLFSKFILIIFSLGVIIHFSCILLRFFITYRAPVTTLFESILFVNLIIALIIIFLMFKVKYNKLIFLYGCGIICLLQYIVYRYEFDGDSIKILMPVLNTNFWLIVHVITISLGYVFCLISGLLGHILLYCCAKNFNKKDILFILSNNIISFCIFALFFSYLGTLLGGIWADQSWGRFWGWDPKENGAMLIVLWLTFVLHLRFTNIYSLILLAVCTILNNVIVSLAWFGVNLLNAGLHSYGFIQNIGENLLIFCIFEFTFIFVFVFLIIYGRRIN